MHYQKIAQTVFVNRSFHFQVSHCSLIVFKNLRIFKRSEEIAIELFWLRNDETDNRKQIVFFPTS